MRLCNPATTFAIGGLLAWLTNYESGFIRDTYLLVAGLWLVPWPGET